MIGKTLSHYRITGHLGAGGMGEVYKAEDTKLGREVAIKVLQTDVARDTARLERFSREARAVAALNHPNIVTIYSVEEADGKHFITMELVEGETLDERIVEGGLPLNKLFDIALPLADALCSAHEKGIVHRDLKPANVMVTKSGSLKVLDFGLAKLQDTDSDVADAETVSRLLTQDGTVLGTYPYMSPEQVEGKHLDQRTDLFSLGTMVYELATGNRPFAGDSSPALMSSILRDEPGPLTEIRPDLPRHLERIVRRCLEKNRRDRYQSARSLYNELKGLRRESVSDASTAAGSVSGVRSGQSTKLTGIAVLPIKGTGSNQEMQDFADGLAEDITAGLSKFPYLSIVARESTLRFAGQTSDIREISEQLGARFVIDGGIRKAGATIRVSMRLVDAQTGTNLWVETYTRNTEAQDIFATQDDITGRVVATVADSFGVLARSMIAEIEDKPDEELAHSEWMLRTFDYLSHMTPETHAHTREGLEKAVKRFPRNPDVWACLSQLYLHEHSFLFNPKPDPLDRALAAAEKAIELDRTCQFGYQLLAQTHFFRQDLAAFRAVTERAISLNPLNSDTIGTLGIVMVHSGDFERGAELTRRAMEMNPHHAGWYHFGPLWLHFANREYEKALARVIQVNMPGLFWTYLATATICGHLGREREARTAVRKLLELDPEFGDNTRQSISVWHFTSGLVEPILEGLRKAGLDVPGEGPGTGETPAPIPTKAKQGKEAVAIAVLPFTDMSHAKDQEFFCEGMAEEIMNALMHVEGIRVASRLSAFQACHDGKDLAAIGRALSVGEILEGSVRVAGGQIRVTAQLIDVESGYQLWSERYDRDAADIFAVQDEIAESVLNVIRARLSPDAGGVRQRARVKNLDAYRHHLKGRFYRYTNNDHGNALTEYERAVELDPDFGPAWVGMAEVRVLAAGYALIPSHRAYSEAREALARAEALQGESAEALYVEGLIRCFLWEWDAAREALTRSAEMRPDHVQTQCWLGFYWTVHQEREKAIAQFELARAVDPLASFPIAMMGAAMSTFGRDADALELLDQANAMEQDNMLAAWSRGSALVGLGRYDEAVESFENAADLTRRGAHVLGALGFGLAKAGRRSEAEAVLAELSARGPDAPTPVTEIWTHAALGNFDAAWKALSRAESERQMMLIFLGMPGWDCLRSDPRFDELLARMGLPAPPIREPTTTSVVAKPAQAKPVSIGSQSDIRMSQPGRFDSVAPASKPFVGRETERQILAEKLSQAREGHGSLVLIGGEPGVGKTRLAEETLSAGRREGMLHFKGHAYEEQGAPFIPTIEILEDLVRQVRPVDLRRQLGDSAAEIARLLPELRRRFPDIPEPADLPPDQQRRYLFNSILALMERVSAESPLVIMMDDIHWADESSMLLLEHIARHLPTLPVLVIGTFRDVEADIGKPFARTLANLVRQGTAERMALNQFGKQEVAELLTAMARSEPPRALVDVIHRETEGNPFFVKEVFEHLSEEGKLFDQNRRWKTDIDIGDLDVPEGVRLVIGRRIERLSPETPTILVAAAAMGLRFDLALAEAIGGDPDAVLDALEEAESAQLISTLPSRRDTRYEFAHALVRHTLLETLSAPRLQRLHLKIAKAMESVYGEHCDEHATALAHHLYEAGAAADATKTSAYLRLAGEQAASTAAYDEAIVFYDRALSMERDISLDERARLLFLRGVAKRAIPRWDDAAADWKYALPIFEKAGEIDIVARICRELGYNEQWRHNFEEAQLIVERGLKAVGKEPSRARCRLLSIYAHAISSSGEFARADALNLEAIAMAESLDDERLLGSEVLLARVYQFELSARGGPMVETGQRAIDLVRRHGTPWEVSSVIGASLWGSMMTGDFDSVDRYVEEIEPLVDREGNLGAKIHCAANSCIVAMARGDLDAATARGQETIDVCAQHGFPWITLGFAWLGMVQFWRGDWHGARNNFDKVVSQHLKKSAHYGAEPAFALAGLATMADASASTSFDDGYPTPRMDEDNGIGAWLWCMARIEAGALLGRLEEAATLYPCVVQLLAEGTRVTWGLGLTEKFAGISAAAGGDWAVAETHFQTALKQAEEFPHRIDQGEVRRWYARMLRDRDAKGDQDLARKLLDEARTLYEQIGMPKHIEMIDVMLADGPEPGTVDKEPVPGATAVSNSLDSNVADTAPRSLAVLPLANLSGDPEQEFFVAGMHDALINELARIKALSVISRTSTIPFADSTEPLPEIAARLGVEAVIEGSVLKAGNQVRINLQLVNAHPEKHLWADSFDGAMEDILDLHRRVAGEVSSAVRARLTEDEEERLETTRKVDPQVYEIYLRARHLGFMTAEPSFQGIRLYEKAIALDQGFAPAYAGMARNYVFLSTLGASSPLGSLAKAAEAARRAMELDPESGEARSIHGYVSLFLDWDWQGAAEAMAEAREMEPNSVLVLADSVLFLALSGDTEQAILHANRATELDPMSPQTLFWKGWARFVAERYEEAIAGFKDSLEIDPDGAYPTLWIGAARGLMGEHAEALVWARRAEDLATDSKKHRFPGGPGCDLRHGRATGRGPTNTEAGRVARERKAKLPDPAVIHPRLAG